MALVVLRPNLAIGVILSAIAGWSAIVTAATADFSMTTADDPNAQLVGGQILESLSKVAMIEAQTDFESNSLDSNDDVINEIVTEASEDIHRTASTIGGSLDGNNYLEFARENEFEEEIAAEIKRIQEKIKKSQENPPEDIRYSQIEQADSQGIVEKIGSTLFNYVDNIVKGEVDNGEPKDSQIYQSRASYYPIPERDAAVTTADSGNDKSRTEVGVDDDFVDGSGLGAEAVVPTADSRKAARKLDTEKVVRLAHGGMVKGQSYTTGNARVEYHRFTGIPYAEPPIDRLRFRPPVKKRAWTGILDGSATKCLQASEFALDGEEDCLHLNVWVPSSPKSGRELLPVMLWIHGGFFLFGSGLSDYISFDRFLEKDILLVSINYRLGPLGFMSLGEDAVSGNMGIKDMILGLEWVRENIEMFGGNPTKITVFGQGSGAIGAHALALSHRSRGLVAGAILQSGNLLFNSNFQQVTNEVERSSRRIADAFGCGNTAAGATLQCLGAIDPKLIMRKAITRKHSFKREDLLSEPAWAWQPVLDGKFSHDPVFRSSPLSMLANGDLPANVPVILGTVAGEGSVYLTSLLDSLDEVEEAWDLLGPSYLLQKSVENVTTTDTLVANTITRFYTGGRNLSESDESGLLDMLTDASFTVSSLITNSLMAKAGAKSFCYILQEATTVDGLSSPVHGDDLVLLFSSQTFDLETVESVSSLMVDTWTNFAKHGDPSPPHSSTSYMDNSVEDADWPPYTAEVRECLLISPEPAVLENPIPERILLWQKLVWEPALEAERPSASSLHVVSRPEPVHVCPPRYCPPTPTVPVHTVPYQPPWFYYHYTIG